MPESGDGWAPEEFTSATCRPVTLPSGETIPVLGQGELSPDGVASLAELVDLVRARMAADSPPDDGAQALWARLDARAFLLGITIRDAAKQAAVKPAVFSRLANGRMPGGEDVALIEAWLETCSASSGTEPTPDAEDSGG